MTTIWTIGYERLRAPELVAELQAAGVRRLIDVRFRPQSRRPGLSKTRLGDALRDQGIAYEHRRALGTPADIRWYYKNRQEAEGERRFRAHLVAPGSEPLAALEALAAELPRAAPTALLCLEADPAVCHRRVVTEELRARVPNLAVVDL